MPTYVKRYEDKTAWMHQSGVDEIKAAVIAQALLDYVDGCKTVIAFSGEYTGKNIEKRKRVKMGRWERIHRQKSLKIPIEEYIMRETLKECDIAQAKAAEAERFFFSPAFTEFCEGSRGDILIDMAREFVREWASDRNDGRWNLTTRAIDDPKKVKAIRKGSYNNPNYVPKRKRGRPPKQAK